MSKNNLNLIQLFQTRFLPNLDSMQTSHSIIQLSFPTITFEIEETKETSINNIIPEIKQQERNFYALTQQNIKIINIAAAFTHDLLIYINEMIQRNLEYEEFLAVLEEVARRATDILEECERIKKEYEQMFVLLSVISKTLSSQNEELRKKKKNIENEIQKLKEESESEFMLRTGGLMLTGIFVFQTPRITGALLSIAMTIPLLYSLRTSEAVKEKILNAYRILSFLLVKEQKLVSTQRTIEDINHHLQIIIQVLKEVEEFWSFLLNETYFAEGKNKHKEEELYNNNSSDIKNTIQKLPRVIGKARVENKRGERGIGSTNEIKNLKMDFSNATEAEFFPGDLNIRYGSPWAGAGWRSNFDSDDEQLQRFEACSYKTLWKLAHLAPDAGIKLVKIYDYVDVKPKLRRDQPWFKKLVPDFRVISKSKLPATSEFGVSYMTVSLNVPKYLRWLLNQFKNSGGQTINKRLAHIKEAFGPDVDVVVNCSGVSARTLGGVEDEAVYPTRGQTVVVWAPHVKSFLTRRSIAAGNHDVTYLIPRDDGQVILGGTFQPNDYNSEPDEKMARELIQKCEKLCPELTHGKGIQSLEITSHNVGLRPSRTGGIRIETEYRKRDDGSEILVCHNYGHHSYGYTSSWGVSCEAFNLIEAAFAKRQEFEMAFANQDDNKKNNDINQMVEVPQSKL
ncbi:7299_t:CDS:10 [Ambispora gerdemannii]|uniref:7299_t:CDS:1 n=1 Tax=Ambispora gerdemannii TaxID=144530 RepID=A0A9N9BFW2_9GLOM|nr:7299_t:CDS:10 [Ambispora gerdemannii]